MRYAQFWHKGLSGKLIPACGDRAVIILDGRQSETTHRLIARQTGAARGYEAFTLHSGRTLCDSRCTMRLPHSTSGEGALEPDAISDAYLAATRMQITNC